MTAINELFTRSFEQSQTYLLPVVKTNRLWVANLEKLINFQISTLQSYVDLGLGQMKTAAEISSYQELQGFLGGQVEFATNLRQKLLDDAKVFADLSASFKADLDKLTEENVSELTEKATKAVVLTPAAAVVAAAKPAAAAAPAPVAAAPAAAPAPAASKKAAATGGSAA